MFSAYIAAKLALGTPLPDLKNSVTGIHFVKELKNIKMQGDQLYMAVCFWYLAKSDLSSGHWYISVHLTSHFLQGIRTPRPCLSGRVVQKE